MSALAQDSDGLIDTTTAMSNLVDILDGQPTSPPSLTSTSRAYLIDIHVLGEKTFSTSSLATGRTFKDILESCSIPKVFFDVRRDSDALYSHFQIRLAGVQDLQLMELATRSFPRRVVCGLARCIERVLLSARRSGAPGWPQRSEAAGFLRPSMEAIARCSMSGLYVRKSGNIVFKTSISAPGCGHTITSQTPDFNGQGQHMALAPDGWSQL
ncbi:hypothetical protein P885DRAFT_64589 [Corynascus similis CBS 632.67]